MQLSRTTERVCENRFCLQMGHSSFRFLHWFIQCEQKLWAQFNVTACGKQKHIQTVRWLSKYTYDGNQNALDNIWQWNGVEACYVALLKRYKTRSRFIFSFCQFQPTRTLDLKYCTALLTSPISIKYDGIVSAWCALALKQLHIILLYPQAWRQEFSRNNNLWSNGNLKSMTHKRYQGFKSLESLSVTTSAFWTT